jgi:hypothetical protein
MVINILPLLVIDALFSAFRFSKNLNHYLMLQQFPSIFFVPDGQQTQD